MKSSNRLLLLGALFAFSLAACGGGGGSSSGGGTVPTGGGTTQSPPSGATPTPVPTTPGSSATPTPSPTSPAGAPISVVNSTNAATTLYDPTTSPPYPFVGAAVNSSQDATIARQPLAAGQPFDGMVCEVFANSYNSHIHLHVSLFVNGTQYLIPAAIGLVNPVLIDGKYYRDDQKGNASSCDYPTKTHEPDGVIHLATNQTNETFTFQKFLDVWNAKLTANGFTVVGDYGSYPGSTRLFVTDESVGSPGSYTVTEVNLAVTDLNTLILKDHQEYTIEVGPAFENTPNYLFGPGLQ